MVLDFGPVSFVDATSVQALIDARRQLDRHAAPEAVEWHFANIADRWTKRALVANGFGFPNNDDEDRDISVTLSIAALTGQSEKRASDEESGSDDISPLGTPGPAAGAEHPGETLYGANWPFFHADLQTAVKNAVESARSRNRAASL